MVFLYIFHHEYKIDNDIFYTSTINKANITIDFKPLLHKNSIWFKYQNAKTDLVKVIVNCQNTIKNSIYHNYYYYHYYNAQLSSFSNNTWIEMQIKYYTDNINIRNNSDIINYILISIQEKMNGIDKIERKKSIIEKIKGKKLNTFDEIKKLPCHSNSVIISLIINGHVNLSFTPINFMLNQSVLQIILWWFILFY